jgi:hypothetical protein
MYRNLVPGLTNVTNRLRYYSFYCWVIDRYEATEHSGNDSKWHTFIRQAEVLYALACNLADTKTADGLAGNIWAWKLLKDRLSRSSMPHSACARLKRPSTSRASEGNAHAARSIRESMNSSAAASLPRISSKLADAIAPSLPAIINSA